MLKANPRPNANSRPIQSASSHIDIAEARTAQGRLYLIVPIDPTSKFALVELHEKMARRTAGGFLRRLIAAVPYKVHTVLTDNATHFTTPGDTSSAAPDIKAALDAGEPVWATPSNTCAQNDIDHRLTKPKRPWTNGQVEEWIAPSKRDGQTLLLRDPRTATSFVDAYNFARRLSKSSRSSKSRTEHLDGKGRRRRALPIAFGAMLDKGSNVSSATSARQAPFRPLTKEVGRS